MAYIVLFHSVLGLRPAELAAADLLRAAGHEVSTPDLYEGQQAATLDEGFAIMSRIGWRVIVERAREAVRKLSGGTVLAGVSMGAGVVGELLPERPDTAGVLLLHGLAALPEQIRPGLPMQVHVADPDDFAPAAKLAAWKQAAIRAGATAQVFTCPRVGHFFIDRGLPDHDEPAASLTWQRSLTFLGSL